MCQLKLIGIGVLLSILCTLLLITTTTEFLILHTLYIGNELFAFWIHISISMVPSLIVYIYLLYGVTVSGDITNPLLPFLIMWIDSKPYLTKNLSKRKPNKTKIYKYCNSYHNACYIISSYLFTLLIMMPIISAISQFLCICLLIIWSIYNLYEYLTYNKVITLNNSYDILILPLLYIAPNFFMYSAMLFTIPIDNESYLVLLMTTYWIISMLYIVIYVVFISSKQQPSDLIMLTELLLLFSTLYICLLISYNSHDILHTFSLIFLIFTALLDGCLLKAVPIKQYIKFENECEIYEHKYGNDYTPALQMNINSKKLYCLIHHTLYHTQKYKQSKDKLIVLKTKDENTYENILQINNDEIHTMGSIECYELQYQFMKMSKNDKHLHINHLLINHKFIEHNKYKQFEQICFNLYWAISIIVGVFPIVWLFYVLLLIKQPYIINFRHYQDVFVLIIIGLYSLMLCVTCYKMYNDYEKYQIIGKLKQIYTNVTDQTKPNQLNKMCMKMLIAKEIIDCFNQIDIAYIILLYMFGYTEFDKKNLNEKEWLQYEMDNLL